jgi:protein phosphatase
MTPATEQNPIDVGIVSDTGNERPHNEDFAAFLRDGETRCLVAVADGVSGYEGGEVASRTAVKVLLASWKEQEGVASAKRLYRAAQQANIEVHDKAIVVPELRGMATTLTAALIDGAELHAAHVGDTRLYRLRGGSLVQLTKDHRKASDATILLRSLGRELIVAVDRITSTVEAGDVLLLCSDGLHNVLQDREMHDIIAGRAAADAARALIDAANARGTIDNLSAAVVRVLSAPAASPPKKSWWR